MTFLNAHNARAMSEIFLETIERYPQHCHGSGIVICAGGVTYLTNAWVCINLLREQGCRLPIQLWYLDQHELDEGMRALLLPLDVECVDASKRCSAQDIVLNGWSLKPFAILQSPFERVLLLDADNISVTDPAYLFDSCEFAEAGAVFWPDFGRIAPDSPIWSIFGVTYRDEPEFESGQVLIDKARCWQALRLCMWYNMHSDFYYTLVHGDKETFHLAFRKLNAPYAMPRRGILRLRGTMCQHDFAGNRIFQHRNMLKWSLFLRNPSVPGFLHEERCLALLNCLRVEWQPVLRVPRFNAAQRSDLELSAAERLMHRVFTYSVKDWGYKILSFSPDGLVALGAGGFEVFWDISLQQGRISLTLSSEDRFTAQLSENGDGSWGGCSLILGARPARLLPLSAAS
jgi:hypothetical protein